MTYIVFFNDKEKGYSFGEKSPDFPAAYETAVQRVCDSVADPENCSTELTAVRYALLEDRYLLSVIFRKPFGDEEQKRGYNAVVNFLLTAAEADDLFAVRTDRELKEICILAERYLNKGGEIEQKREREQRAVIIREKKWDATPGVCGTVPARVLLSAALFSETMDTNRPKQAFIALESDPLCELTTVMRCLPRALRKQVSFHSGIISARESCGTALNFATAKRLSKIVADRYDHSQLSDKYTYGLESATWGAQEEATIAEEVCRGLTMLPCGEFFFPLLMRHIRTWQEWKALAEIGRSKEPLETALALIPEEKLREELQRANLPRDVVQELRRCGIGSAAAPKRDPLRIEPAPQHADAYTGGWVQEENAEDDRAAKREKKRARRLEREQKERTPGAAARLAGGAVRLVIFVALVAAWIVALLLLLRPDISEKENIIQVTFTVAQLKSAIYTILALVLTAAVFFCVGRWSGRKRNGQKRKEIEE